VVNPRAADWFYYPGSAWLILRLYTPLELFFTKTWRPSEIELVPLALTGRGDRLHQGPDT
jgi:hypothetical protein